MDLNMVRAGVVTHPEQWPQSGYVEIQYPKARGRIIDEGQLMGLVGEPTVEQCCSSCAYSKWKRDWNESQRQSHWTESLAVGCLEDVEALQKQLGVKAQRAGEATSRRRLPVERDRNRLSGAF